MQPSDDFHVANAMHKEGWTMQANNASWHKMKDGWRADVGAGHRAKSRWVVSHTDSRLSGLGLMGDTNSVDEAQRIAEAVLQFMSKMPRSLIDQLCEAQREIDRELNEQRRGAR